MNSLDVDRIDRLSTLVGELVDEGVSMASFNVRFLLKKFNDLRPVMIADATMNAKELAKQFAKNSGSRVGSIRRANQGVMSIMSADASPNNQYDTGESALMKKIRVVSTFDFFIED